MPFWVSLTLGGAALAAIAWGVGRRAGHCAAAVVAAIGTLALAVLALSYSPVDLEGWRRGHVDRTLLVFALPAACALALALLRTGRRGLSRDGWLYLAALWLAPSALVWGSQVQPFPGIADVAEVELANLLWFAVWSIAVYVTVPVVYARVTHQPIRSYGLSLTLLRREWLWFAGAVPVLIAAVWFFSAEERFADTYPFYDPADSWSALLLWEAVYGLTFVALEFFFRGFLVFAGLRVLGIHAVPVMAFTYCLIHLAKPMPEAVSSLIGGLILGYLALRFRSILVGVAAHLTIAWGMDGAVLLRR